MARTIRRLMMRNFRLVADLDLPLDRCTLLVGPTGSGKSSVRLGIEYAITRRNEMTDGRGSGIASQVRHGCKAGSIVLESDEGTRTECEFPTEKGTAQKTAAALAYLGLTDTLAPAILRGEAFLDRSDAERRAVLQHVLGIDLRQERMIGMLNTWSEAFPDLGEWLDSMTADLKWNGRDYAKLAGEQRTIAGRLKDEAEKRLGALRARVLDEEGQPAPPADIPADDLLEAQGRRDDLMRDIGALDASEAPAQQAYQAALQARETAIQQHRASVTEYQRLNDQAEAAKKNLTPPPEGYRSAEVLQGELAHIASRIAAATAVVDANNARIASLTEERRRVAAGVASAKVPCPTCGHAWDPAGEARLGQIDRELDELRKPLPAVQELELLRMVQQQTSQAAVWASGYDSKTGAARDTLRRIQPQMIEVQDRNAHWQEPPEPTPPASRKEERQGLLSQLRQVDSTIAELTQVKETREQWDRDYRALEQLEVETESRVNDWARWDALVKALEPRGLAARVSKTAVDTWANEVDKTCRKWFGIGFHVEFGEKSWDFHCHRRNGWTPQEQLSGGERLLVSAAIQVSIARRTGLHVVFLDEVQRADALLRVRLVGYLLASGVQAVLCASAQVHEKGAWVRPKAPAVDGLSMWWVEEGCFEQIRPEVA